MNQGRPSLLVYRPGALGDALVSLPALSAARKRFGAGRTIFATAAALVSLLTDNDLADIVISADDSRLVPLFAGDVGRFSETFGAIGTAVLWGGESLTPAASALLERGVEVIHSRSRPGDECRVHVSEYLVRSVDPGTDSLGRPPSLTPSQDDLAWFDAEFPAELRRPMVVIHPGSGSARKNWPPESFATLVNMVRDELDLECAIIAGPADDGLVEGLLPLLSATPRLVARSWPLGRVAALLARSTVYLGNDSGISHLAGCIGVRGVALFGPTDPKVWAPLADTIHPLSQPSMADHRPEDVFAALRELTGIR